MAHGRRVLEHTDEAGSMQIDFMRDAATGFAVLALLGGTGLH
jgi:hypothetical protein